MASTIAGDEKGPTAINHEDREIGSPRGSIVEEKTWSQRRKSQRFKKKTPDLKLAVSEKGNKDHRETDLGLFVGRKGDRGSAYGRRYQRREKAAEALRSRFCCKQIRREEESEPNTTEEVETLT
ncbi:hypothetical protein MRB53_001166 [Persea americana]|uniref:Uncharacterized protein n=1 Tax=Persea americana TaxID=3435 RepID=A0ACC2MR91_PERAE|nr:hypothetical protein MRB53_001166 [Persea americana]